MPERGCFLFYTLCLSGLDWKGGYVGVGVGLGKLVFLFQSLRWREGGRKGGWEEGRVPVYEVFGPSLTFDRACDIRGEGRAPEQARRMERKSCPCDVTASSLTLAPLNLPNTLLCSLFLDTLPMFLS